MIKPDDCKLPIEISYGNYPGRVTAHKLRYPDKTGNYVDFVQFFLDYSEDVPSFSFTSYGVTQQSFAPARQNILTAILNTNTYEDILTFSDTFGLIPPLFEMSYNNATPPIYRLSELLNVFDVLKSLILLKKELLSAEPDSETVVPLCISLVKARPETLCITPYDLTDPFSVDKKNSQPEESVSDYHSDCYTIEDLHSFSESEHTIEDLWLFADQVCNAFLKTMFVSGYGNTNFVTFIGQPLMIITDVYSAIGFSLYQMDFTKLTFDRCKKPDCNRYFIRYRGRTSSQYCCETHARCEAQKAYRKRK